MTEYFSVLSDAEYKQLKDAISLVTLYIAEADGVIEENETKWAEKVTKIRSYNLPPELSTFYKEVGEDFHDVLEGYRSSLPTGHEEKMETIEGKLRDLNPILAKVDPKLGAEMYNSLKSFAKHVAKASGGFLGFFSIGPAEAELMQLPMIDPIEYTPEEEA